MLLYNESASWKNAQVGRRMAQEQAKHLLQQGIAAAQAGQADHARDLLRQAARLDPQNETAWMWLTSVAESNAERVFCLRQILQINPNNERARQGLQQLGATAASPSVQGSPGDGSPAPQGISVPVVDEPKHARLQQAADDFLRRYNPEPLDRLQIDWTHKSRRRYAEMGEQRMRRVIVAVMAVVAVGLLAGLLVLISQLDISLGGDTESGSGYAFVSSPTSTATMTPTLGGATPTPFPDDLSIPPSSTPPAYLSQQSGPYEIMNPTEIYPPPNSFALVGVREAVKYYAIGDYDTAIEKLEAEIEGAGQNCYESVYYFLALSLAKRGDSDEATQLLRAGLNMDTGRFESCEDSALLIAGLGEVAWMSGNLEAAYNFSIQALDKDPRLVQASLTAARAKLAQGQIQNAWRILKDALAHKPDDINLLLQMAQVELASGQLRSALDYVGQVLFIEPVSQSGLQLQAQIYLMLAEASPANSDVQREYYGLAVLSAQTLLLYYPGDPVGYLYLAQARFGEGNFEMAATELTRIIAAEDVLPESAAPIIRTARLLRGNLAYQRGQFQAAWDDLEPIALSGPTGLDQEVAERLVDIALRLGRFSDAVDWIDQLRFAEPANAEYVLLEAKALAEICTFYPDEIACQYDGVLNSLDDQFLSRLATDAQRAQAYSYRAQALYHDTKTSALNEDERALEFRLALNDVEQALSVRESPVDRYYRGLLLEELDEPFQAFEEYQRLTYWDDQAFGYPFVDDRFEERAAALADVVQLTVVARATEEPPIVLPTQPPPTNTPVPTETPTPTLTPTPSPAPTALPSVSIP